VTADYSQAKLQSETDKALFDLGVISGLAYKNSKSKADELTTRNNIEDERLDINQKAIASQMAEQQAKVDENRALAELKQKQLDALKVRAGIEGVLVDLPCKWGSTFCRARCWRKLCNRIPDCRVESRRDAGTRRADRPTRNGRHAQWNDCRLCDASRSRGSERHVTVDVKLTGELRRGPARFERR